MRYIEKDVRIEFSETEDIDKVVKFLKETNYVFIREGRSIKFIRFDDGKTIINVLLHEDILMLMEDVKCELDAEHVPDYMNLCPLCGLLYYHDEVVNHKGQVLCAACHKVLRAKEKASEAINKVSEN